MKNIKQNKINSIINKNKQTAKKHQEWQTYIQQQNQKQQIEMAINCNEHLNKSEQRKNDI